MFMCLVFNLLGLFEFFIFALFYFLLDLSFGECNVISLYFMCFSVYGSVNCLVKKFVIFLGVVVKCYGVVQCGWRCSVGYTMYGLPKNVRVVPVIPVCI